MHTVSDLCHLLQLHLEGHTQICNVQNERIETTAKIDFEVGREAGNKS